MKDVDFRTKEQKIADFKNWCKVKWNKFVLFVRDNKDILTFVVPFITVIISGGSRIISRMIASRTVRRDIQFKERTIYDRSLGRYTELKRPLKAKESLEIERRRKNGESLNSILDDMRLLKK